MLLLVAAYLLGSLISVIIRTVLMYKHTRYNHAHGMHENNHFVMVLTLLIFNQSEDMNISAFLSENISIMQRKERRKIKMMTTVHIDICVKNSIIQTIFEYITMC